MSRIVNSGSSSFSFQSLKSLFIVLSKFLLLNNPSSIIDCINFACPGYRKVFSFIFGMCVIVVNNERRPSVLNASNIPTSSISNSSISDSAGFISTSEFIIILAGRVYSSITSMGEKGAL